MHSYRSVLLFCAHCPCILRNVDSNDIYICTQQHIHKANPAPVVEIRKCNTLATHTNFRRLLLVCLSSQRLPFESVFCTVELT